MNIDLVKEKIENYFQRLMYLITKVINNDLSDDYNELLELENLLYNDVDIISLLEIATLMSESNKNIVYEDYIHSLFSKEKGLYLPIELLESDKKIAYFGSALNESRFDNFKLSGDNNFTFQNENRSYNLVSLHDLKKLGNIYDIVLLDDNIIYKNRKNLTDLPLEQRTVNNDVYDFICRLNRPIDRYFEYKKLYDCIERYYYNFFANHIIYNELNSEIKNKIIASHSFDCYTKYQFFSKDNGEYNKKCQRDNLVKSYLEKKDFIDSDYIMIRFANLKNWLTKSIENRSQGYLKISKTNPMYITPINLNEEEIQWLKFNLDDFTSIIEIMIDSSESLDDLFFTCFASCERYPKILLEEKQELCCTTNYNPENKYLYFEFIKKLNNSRIRTVDDMLGYLQYSFLNISLDAFNELFQEFNLLCTKYKKEDSLLGAYVKKYQEDSMVKKYGKR